MGNKKKGNNWRSGNRKNNNRGGGGSRGHGQGAGGNNYRQNQHGGGGGRGGGPGKKTAPTICRNFVQRKCQRTDCRFVHRVALAGRAALPTKDPVTAVTFWQTAERQLFIMAQKNVLYLGPTATVGTLMIHKGVLFCGFSDVFETSVPVGMIRCWNLANAQEFEVWGTTDRRWCHKDAITDIVGAEVKGTTIVFSASKDTTIRMYTLNGARFVGVSQFDGHLRSVTSLLWVQTATAARLFSASEDRTINVWNPAAPAKPTFTLSGTHEAAITGLSTFPVVQPTGGTTPYLLSTGMDGRVAMYALSSLDAPAQGRIACAALAAYPSASKNVLVLGMTNGYVCFRLVAPEFPDQGSLRDGWNAGHKAGTIVRAVLPVSTPSGHFIFTAGEDGQFIPWQYNPAV